MPIVLQLPGSLRLLALAAIAGLAAGCRDANQYVPPPPPTVSVAQPLVRTVTRYFELTGNTKAFAAVELEARVQGFLEAITYKDGAVVKKGTPLFSIQRNTYEAQLKQAQGALAAQQRDIPLAVPATTAPGPTRAPTGSSAAAIRTASGANTSRHSSPTASR